MTLPIKPLCLAVATCWAVSSAAADTPTCPKTLQVAERPATIPDGFRAFANGNPPTEDISAAEKMELTQIMFSDGPPTEMAWLAPTRDERTYQGYDVNSGGGKQTWLSCGYSNTAIIISLPLPPAIKACKVTHDPAVQGYPATGMTCR
jgi:hypothetical protein